MQAEGSLLCFSSGEQWGGLGRGGVVRWVVLVEGLGLGWLVTTGTETTCAVLKTHSF